ncbi:hypothetical protein ACS0TY_026232 [Phlomoides rotata]
METSELSFHLLLRDISEATLRREQSETDYQDLLRVIFKQGGPHDASRWEAPNRPSLYGTLLLKTFKKGALHADPEVESKVEVEHLPILEGEKVFGRREEMRKLLLKCCNPDDEGIQLCAIPIVGAAGIGKTTLARLIYEHVLVQEHFEMRVWVKVDGQEFNLHHAAQQILKSAMGMPCSTDDPDELDEMVRDTLQWRRCLIVFDGVESMTQDLWLHMKKMWFDSVDLWSVVLITTPSEDVANLVSNEAFELRQLSQDEGCRQLVLASSDFEDMSGHVVENLEALCGNIPMLIKLVESMMRYHDNLKHLLDAIKSLPTCDASVAILLCVWALPPELRQCLAFCAIFPKGYALERVNIINMWAAHGLLKTSPKHNLHDIGDSYFHQLLCRFFFTDISRNEYGDITEFRMPGLIHPIMQDVASIVWKGKVGVIGSISVDAHQLSVHLEGPEDVRTLILSSTLYSGARSLDCTFLDFRELESLDLSCSGIRNLSDDICSLTELRHLNLSYTLIETLPNSIRGFPRLQTLDLSWCYHFKVLPKDPDSARLGELAGLNQLRGRLDIKNLENVAEISEARKAKLNKKIKLHHLGLSWSQIADNCFEVLELLEPNIQLQDLNITGYSGSRFPRWISSTNGLTKISITDCGSKELPSLGQLPILKELQLKGMTNLDRIGPEFYGDAITDVFFPSLQQFGLYDLPRLSEWSGETAPNSSGISFQCQFQSLKTLTIEACPKLASLPPLPTLPDLIVGASNDTILSSLASFTSLSSLLINDMELGVSNFQDLTWLDSLKNLILCNVKDKLIVNISHVGTALQHLSILHCHQLTDLSLFYFSSLQKLHVIDCPNLYRILVREEKETPLVELVVEDCPELISEVCFGKFPALRKLIGKNCGGDFTIYNAGDYKKLEKLEYLFITGCSRVELELKTFPSLISHVPCIIVGDQKVNYEELKDLIEVPTRTSYESKTEDLLHRRSYNKVKTSLLYWTLSITCHFDFHSFLIYRAYYTWYALQI